MYSERNFCSFPSPEPSHESAEVPFPCESRARTMRRSWLGRALDHQSGGALDKRWGSKAREGVFNLTCFPLVLAEAGRVDY